MKVKNFSTARFDYVKSDLIRLIDIKENNDCWFQCLHSYSVFYKTPVQIINNRVIVEKLMPLEASMIGLVCGESYKNYLRTGKMPGNSVNYHLNRNENESDFTLVHLNRDGSLQCEDNVSKRYFEINILDLIKKKEFIKKFSSYDAYYIGFLAGVELFKVKNNLTSISRKPILRLIKY